MHVMAEKETVTYMYEVSMTQRTPHAEHHLTLNIILFNRDSSLVQ